MFNSCVGLTSIIIPDSVTSIGNYVFSWCYNLTSVTIGNGVKSIGDGAFGGCGSLTSLIIPDGVKSIGDGEFQYCSSLTGITIPDSVTSIGNYAFYGCDNLKNAYYYGSSSKWQQISMSSGNECLTSAKIHYNFKKTSPENSFVKLKDSEYSYQLYEYSTLKTVEAVPNGTSNGFTVEKEGYYNKSVVYSDYNEKALSLSLVPESTKSEISSVICNGVDAFVSPVSVS